MEGGGAESRNQDRWCLLACSRNQRRGAPRPPRHHCALFRLFLSCYMGVHLRVDLSHLVYICATSISVSKGLYIGGVFCLDLGSFPRYVRRHFSFKFTTELFEHRYVGIFKSHSSYAQVWLAGGKRGGRTTNKISVCSTPMHRRMCVYRGTRG